MLIGLFKTAMFIFPFFKELFLGKENPSGVKTGAFHVAFKKIVIGVGCAAIVTNVYLLDRLFTLAHQHVLLNREIAQLRLGNATAPSSVKKEAPALLALPKEVPVNDPAKQHLPIAMVRAPALRNHSTRLAPNQPVPTAPAPLGEDLERLHRLGEIE